MEAFFSNRLDIFEDVFNSEKPVVVAIELIIYLPAEYQRFELGDPREVGAQDIRERVQVQIRSGFLRGKEVRKEVELEGCVGVRKDQRLQFMEVGEFKQIQLREVTFWERHVCVAGDEVLELFTRECLLCVDYEKLGDEPIVRRLRPTQGVIEDLDQGESGSVTEAHKEHKVVQRQLPRPARRERSELAAEERHCTMAEEHVLCLLFPIFREERGLVLA